MMATWVDSESVRRQQDRRRQRLFAMQQNAAAMAARLVSRGLSINEQHDWRCECDECRYQVEADRDAFDAYCAARGSM